MRPFLAVILIALPLAALADQAAIQVDHVWSRAAIAGRTGVVYLTITDRGAPDALTGAASPVATMAELHQNFDDHGVMKMRPVATLKIDPGKPITLAPGGYHIMLMVLKRDLKPGESFPITLTFAKAGQITATATVSGLGPDATGGMPPHMNMPMGGGKQP